MSELARYALNLPKPGEWVFTFGPDHRHPDTHQQLGNCFIRIKADSYRQARDKMVERFGYKWAFQYESMEKAGVFKYGLTEVY